MIFVSTLRKDSNSIKILSKVVVWFLLFISFFLPIRTATISQQNQNDHQPWCSPENLSFQSMLNAPPHLYLQGDGSFVMGFNHCRMRNFEGRHFRDVFNAFKRNHILFFGDSLTRYTYVSLAYFLGHRKWIPSFAHQDEEGLSVCSEFQFKNWTVFYELTNNRLTTWRKPTTIGEIRRHPFAAIEVCDCKRKETDVFFEKNCENRYMRILPISGTTAYLSRQANDSTVIHELEADLDDVQDDIRLSYSQWWGKNRGHVIKKIASIPRSGQFLHYVNDVNNLYCSDRFNNTLIPLTINCEVKRLSDSDLPCEQMDLPFFPNEKTEENGFLAEFLPVLNATHMIVNTGIWSPLISFKSSLMRSMIRAAHEHLNIHDRNNELKLKPFLLRETYMTTWIPHYPPYVYEADRELLEGIKNTAQYREDVDVMWSWELTKLIGEWHHIRHTNGASTYWKNVTLSVDYLRKKGLLSWIRHHPKAHLYPEVQTWNDVPQSTEEQFLDKYRGLFCGTDLAKEIIDTKMKFGEDVGYIYEDNIHFAPYIYNEVNKVFLSAVTPHIPVIEHSKIKKTSE